VKLKEDQKLFIYSMGKKIRVTAIFHDDAEANKYMERHKDEGVIACFTPYVFIANVYDLGQEAEREEKNAKG
jgi:hypothetical protein